MSLDEGRPIGTGNDDVRKLTIWLSLQSGANPSLDVHLPDMAGLDFIERTKSRGGWTLVEALTAHLGLGVAVMVRRPRCCPRRRGSK